MTISCLTVTQYSRYTLFEKALASFAAQTFDASKREIIIVHHDGKGFDEQLRDLLKIYHISNFSVISVPPAPLGELRNISMRKASGDLFCQWDDDDFYHEDRLVTQSNPFLNSEFVASTLEMQIFWFIQLKEIYIRRGGTEGIHGSIMFKSDLKQKYASDLSRGEDSRFIQDVLEKNPVAIHCIKSRPELYVRTVHGGNTWDIDHHRMQIAQAMDRSWLKYRELDIRQWLHQYRITGVQVRDKTMNFVFNIDLEDEDNTY